MRWGNRDKATADLDATILESHKQGAHGTYDGPPPLLQATVLALGLAAGVLAGARLAPWLPAPRLRQALAIAALVAALALLARMISGR